jgi:hypothetical protein
MKRTPLQEMLDAILERGELQKVQVTAEELKALDMEAFHAFILVDALKQFRTLVGERADSLMHYVHENVTMATPLIESPNADRLMVPLICQGQCVMLMQVSTTIIENLMNYIVLPVVHKHAQETFEAEKGGLQ